MIFVDKEVKNDPVRRWNLKDSLFFSNGACHILAYVFLERFPDTGFLPYWVKPDPDFKGNHIFVASKDQAFDYKGFSSLQNFFNDLEAGMEQHYCNWKYETILLDKHILVSEEESRKLDGLWLRPPEKFLHNPIPRAQAYLNQFPVPENLSGNKTNRQ